MHMSSVYIVLRYHSVIGQLRTLGDVCRERGIGKGEACARDRVGRKSGSLGCVVEVIVINKSFCVLVVFVYRFGDTILSSKIAGVPNSFETVCRLGIE